MNYKLFNTDSFKLMEDWVVENRKRERERYYLIVL